MQAKKCDPGRLAAKARETLQDEVYRQMYRVDSRIFGADLDLAMTLVRAWVAVEAEPPDSDLRTWLAVVSPLCMQMIDAFRRREATVLSWVN